MNCPSCGAELPQAAKFCGSCGYQFASRGASTAVATSGGGAPSIEALVAQPLPFPVMGDLIKQGWEIAKPNLGILIGGAIVLGLAVTIAAMTVVGLLAVPALAAGGAIVALRLVNGKAITLNDFFLGIKLFIPMLLLGIVQGFLTNVGMYLLVVPGIYLSVAWSMSQFVMIDRGLEFWPAMEASRQVVHKHWWNVFGFFLLIGIANIVIAIPTCYLGMLITGPVSLIAMTLLYKSLFGMAGGADRIA